MRRIFISLLLFVTMDAFSQNGFLDSIMRVRNEYYFSFEMANPRDIVEIVDVVSVDKVYGSKIIAYANSDEYAYFRTLGYEVELLTPPSMSENHKMYDGRTRSEYEWNEYPTYEAYVAIMEEFSEKYSDKCSLIELGTLESGRKILLARINDGNPDGKPKFLYGSTIHGDETTGFVMMLRLIDHILTRQDLPEVQNVLNNIDLFICPNANPDGTYRGGNHTVTGATRSNAYGVDMNRNYPDPVYGSHPDDEDYALETELFMQLANDYQFVMAAHYHGGAEVVNYPWDNSYARHADDDWWQMVSRQYADLAHEKNPYYMTDEKNGITNGADWYRIGGGRQDYMNYYHQCRELTLECSTVKCPSASDLPLYWEYNYNSIFAFLSQSLFGIHGTVKDAKTQQALKATIKILNHDQDYSMVESQLPGGDFHRPINAGTYIVEINADGYCPVQKTVTVTDGEAINIDVELESVSTITYETYMMEDVEIFPNPVRNHLYVNFNEGKGNVNWNLISIHGQSVKKAEEKTDDFIIELSDVNGGIYFLSLTFEDKQIIKKIVVE